MRLSNRRKLPLYRFFYTCLALMLGLGIVFFLLDFFSFNLLGWKGYLVLGIPLLLVTVFAIRGRQLFDYDSDGEALNFSNKSVVPFVSKPLRDEFPKYKLMKYELINGFIFKRLYITITSKKSHSVTLKYDVSYLTNKEIKDLKLSLNRVLKSNKENKQRNDNKS